MRSSKLIALFLISTLAACAPSEKVQQDRIGRLSNQLQQFQHNPEIIAFLAEEAANAGVRRVIPFAGTNATPSARAPAYGMARERDKTNLRMPMSRYEVGSLSIQQPT